MEISELIATFFVGLVVSYIGSMVGSAGLINIPFLIFMGLRSKRPLQNISLTQPAAAGRQRQETAPDIFTAVMNLPDSKILRAFSGGVWIRW